MGEGELLLVSAIVLYVFILPFALCLLIWQQNQDMKLVLQRVNELRAVLFPEVNSPFVDDESRCAVCGWPLARSVDKGCTRGHCSQRPLPVEHLYAPDRARQEYGASAYRSDGSCIFPHVAMMNRAGR